VLRRLLLECKPSKTLEVGLACGGSALTFATTLRDLGHSPNGQHVAIDAWQRDGFDDVGRVQLEKAGLDGYVDIRESLSSYELARLAEMGERFGLIYIDGSHRFEDVFVDFYFARAILEPAGYLLFDDSADGEVARVVKFIQKNLREYFRQLSVCRYRDVAPLEKATLWIGEKMHRTQLTIFRKLKDGERPASQRMRPF
jgi:cephalosporin hydroxylase